MQFHDFSLDSSLLRAVDEAGFKTPTPIQEQAIPAVLSGGDLMASSQTGSGKTAAFVLPLLQRLLSPSEARGHGPRVLILSPTRELASQIVADIRKFTRFAKLRSGTVVGGVSYGPQIQMLGQSLDLLVATPGRLVDHLEAGRIDFRRLETFVLDEADRMLDMGFKKDLLKILAQTPEQRQTLLFSATLEGEVLRLAERYTREPAVIRLAANKKSHQDIRQQVFQTDDSIHKNQLLRHHLKAESLNQAVIFTRTKHGADRLAKKLSKEGHRCAALHGDMRQSARQRTIDKMKAGDIRVLVATDVAARGLDIKGISHVINFDLPMVAEDYIHRIGRTGRAGAQGTAISFVGYDDWKLLNEIQRLTGSEMERDTVVGLEPVREVPTYMRKPKSFGPKGAGQGPSRRRSGPGRSRRSFKRRQAS